ncbi:hypothetical protein VF21_03581 [Pseudogymnoascus sp. 05NY08]|nr:hypothetical protein VF21_03581 [Pseudogymnoascus sp. 05NY08]
MAATRQEIAGGFLAAENESLLQLAEAVITQGGYIDDPWMASQLAHSGYSVLNTAHQIFMATPTEVLRGLIQGDLPALAGNSDLKYMQSAQYVAFPSVITMDNITLPVVYAIYLVNLQTSQPPSVRHIREMVDAVEIKVGSMQGTSKAAAKDLARYLKNRISGCISNSPLAGGLVDVGFAGNGVQRLAQHQSGVNSNEVMQVFGDAAKSIDKDYGLQGFIVTKMRTYEQCSLAEVLPQHPERPDNAVVSWDRIGAVNRDRIYNSNLDVEIARMKAATAAGRRQVQRTEDIGESLAIQDSILELLSPDERARAAAAEQEIQDGHGESQKPESRVTDSFADQPEPTDDDDEIEDDEDNIVVPGRRR